MSQKRKRRKHKKRGYLIFISILLVSLVVALIYFFLNFNFSFLNIKSIHNEALTYKTKNCLAFYPNSETGKEKAKNICDKSKGENSVYDYALIPYGDYYLVDYADGTNYFIDKNYKDLQIPKISSENGKMIVSDYLRYSMKKAEIDEAYTSSFLEETYYQNLDLDDTKYKIDGDNLVVHFNKYNHDVGIPLKYMQEALDLNLGYQNEDYKKPRYVSKDRKKICFTFDDGPDLSFETSGQIVDTLYKYDSAATFFILGNRLYEKQINYIKQASQIGMEYGSHTQSHADLTKLSNDEARNEILTPANDLKNGFNYQMKLFRPPYGAIKESVLNATDLKAILWNVDSLDWLYRNKYGHDECVKVIYEKVIKEADENDIILFHDIYKTSADASCELIKYFIDQGYQIVTVSELMDSLNVSSKRFSGK